MGEQALAARQLKQLLDGVLVAHREDINAFAGGHLNESNLRRHVEQTTRTSWVGALGQIPTIIPKSSPRRKSKPKHEEDMKETMATFSLGTAGGLGLPPVKGKKKQKPSKLVKDNTFVEELKLPELMLQETEYHDEQSRASPVKAALIPHHGTEDAEADHEEENVEENARDDLELLVRHRFIPAHHEAITKHDQYASMKAFEAEIVRKKDGEELHVLSGVKAVEHLEASLEQGLDSLPYEMSSAPNFHRLQIYSAVFEDLVASSPTFSLMLNIIKQEYDDFVSSLLDNQAGRHQALHEQVAQLSSARGTSNSLVLSKEAQRVHELESEAKQLLETNERLRKELQEEKELAQQPIPATPVHAPVRRKEPPMDLVDEVESLRGAVLERMDDVNKLRQSLQQNMVPATVCTHLEQCIKETEIEIQKTISQKQYFERNISEMEADLQDALNEADTTQHDAKRVWSKLSCVMGDGASQSDDDDSTEENKWSWYIS